MERLLFSRNNMNFETYNSLHTIEMDCLKIIVIGLWMEFSQGLSASAVTRSLSKPPNDATQITDFKEFVQNHRNIYVDKTLFLPDFMYREEKYKGPIIFVTKPPGFGKSLLASTVDYFFNSKYDVSESKRLFSGLQVMADTPAVNQFREENMNRFPVIMISFASFQAGDFKSALKEVERIFQEVIKDHATVADHFKDPTLERIANGTADEECLREFIQLLCGYVIDHHHEDPILIIDAYDTPLYSAYAASYYNKMAALMGYIFNLGVFNDGFYRYKKALITGMATVELDRVRLRKEITYAKPDDHDPLAEFFGFTKKDVVMLLARNARSEDNYRTLVTNFGGYGFRDFNATMFNPRGVIRYFDKGTLDGGVDTTSTNILKELLTVRKYGLYPILSVQKLLAYESVRSRITDQLYYPNIRELSTHYWTFLMCFGLASRDLRGRIFPDKIVFKIPNSNVRTALAHTLTETPGIPDYNNLTENLIQGAYIAAQNALKTYLQNAGAYVLREDKFSERYARLRHTRLYDYVNDLLDGVKMRYDARAVTGHRPGLDYITLVPRLRYGYEIRVRIEKTGMLKAKWNSIRSKICSLISPVAKNETEIFIQYSTSFVDVCWRRCVENVTFTTRRYDKHSIDWE